MSNRNNPVRRLRISFKNGQWNIDKEISLKNKIILKSQDLPSAKDTEDIPGSWYEARDNYGKTLYRRFIPLFGKAETFGGDSILTMNIPPEKILLDLLLPDSPQLAELHIFSDNEDFKSIMKKTGRPTNPVGVIKIKKKFSKEKEGM